MVKNLKAAKWCILIMTACFLAPFSVTKALAQPEVAPVPARVLVLLKNSKPDTNRINLLLEIGSDHLQFTYVPKPDLDSALKYANRAIKLSDSLHQREFKNQALILKGYTYIRMQQLDKGTDYFMQAINDYKRWGHKLKEAQAWKSLGDVITSDMQKNSAKRIAYYQQAESIYHQNKLWLKSIEVQKQIADVYLNAGNLDEAEKRFLTVLKQLKAIHYKNLHYTYDLLAAVARLEGDLKKQLYYRFEVVKSIEATGDYEHAVEFYGRLASVYNSLNMYDKADFYYKKSLSSVNSKFYSFYFYLYIIQYANNLIAENKAEAAVKVINDAIKKSPPVAMHDRIFADQALGESYFKLQKLSLAKKYFLTSAKLADSAYRANLLNIPRYFGSNMNVAEMFISVKQFPVAALYLKRLSKLPKNAIDPITLSNYELNLYAIDSANNNLHSALSHYKRYTQLRDSIFSITKTKQLDSLQFKIETEKKDKHLALQSKNIAILTKYSALQKSKFEQSILIRNLVIAGSALLFILSVLLYHRYRTQLHSTKLLEQQRKEINHQNKSLQVLTEKQKALITEKEWLIKEVHHRVKNNLQIVISLLSSQSVYLKDEVALNAMAESRHRVQAMSLIHQKLYQSDNISDIYMPEYISNLVEYLKDSFEIKQTVRFDLQVEKIRLDVAKAVPLGLILNETITNALKHAFPHSEEDTILIKLTSTVNNEVSLTVADNGYGLPEEFDISNNKSFGITLMKGMTEDLEGSFKIYNQNGTNISLTFLNAPATLN